MARVSVMCQASFQHWGLSGPTEILALWILYFRAQVVKLAEASEPPGGLVKSHYPTPTSPPPQFASVGLLWGLEICMSNRSPGVAAGLCLPLAVDSLSPHSRLGEYHITPVSQTGKPKRAGEITWPSVLRPREREEVVSGAGSFPAWL